MNIKQRCHKQSFIQRTDQGYRIKKNPRYSYDVLGNRDTGGTAQRDTWPMMRKVKLKDLEKEGQSKDTRDMLVFAK